MTGFPAGRVAVLSPHLDDAVFGVGAAISRAVNEGAHVRVVTVFAGDVASELPASNWDRLAGFATEGAAARARRAEDAAACAVVGAESHPLSFSDYPYRQIRDREAIQAAIAVAVDGSDAILIPGFPLLHPDHSLVAECVLSGGLAGRRVALYAEQPYRFRARWERRRAVADSLRAVLPGQLEWRGIRVEARDRSAKRRALRAYRSQLPLLGLGGPGNARLLWMLAWERVRGGEAIAWVTPPPDVPFRSP